MPLQYDFGTECNYVLCESGVMLGVGSSLI